jgi:O-antigen ligase
VIFFYLLVVVMPLTQHPLWSGVVADVTVVKYVGIAALLQASAYLATRGKPAPDYLGPAQNRWFLILAGWAFLSRAVFGPVPDVAMNPFLSYLSFVGLLYMTCTIVDSSRRLHTVLLVAVGSVALASAYVLREWQKAGFASSYRPGWVTGDPNYYSVSALLCLPVAVSLLRARPRQLERAFLLGSTLITLLALTAAASRGALLGLAVAIAVATWRSRHRARLALVASVVLFPLLILSPSSPLSRFLDPSRGDEVAQESRLRLWAAGLQMMEAHPLMGIGAGHFKDRVRDFGADDSQEEVIHIAHSTYVGLGAEMGLPALLFLGLTMTYSLQSTARVRRLLRDQPRALLRCATEGIELGLIGFLAAAAFLSAEYQKLFWLFVFLTACLLPLARRQRVVAKARARSGEEVSAQPDAEPAGESRALRGAWTNAC